MNKNGCPKSSFFLYIEPYDPPCILKGSKTFKMKTFECNNHTIKMLIISVKT